MLYGSLNEYILVFGTGVKTEGAVNAPRISQSRDSILFLLTWHKLGCTIFNDQMTQEYSFLCL
jgi:hypothetical protein